MGPLSWQQLISRGITGGINLFIAAKILALLPICLEVLKLPNGTVSHDPWSWAPIGLDLLAAVAVAAPTSLAHLTQIFRSLRFPKT